MDIAKLGFEINSAPATKAASDLDKMTAAAGRAETGTEKMARKIEREMSEMNRSVQAATGFIKGFVGAFLSVQGLRAFSTLADQAGQLRSRIQLVTGAGEKYLAVQQRIEQVARSSYKSVADISEVFINAAKPMQQLGMSTQQTLDLMEAFSVGLVVSGSNAQASASAIYQFGQAMQTGVLRGQEFNTVLQTNSAFVDALEKSLGKSRAELVAMARDGKLTVKDLAGVASELDNLREAADSMPVTWEDAMTRIRDSLMKFFDAVNTESGALQVLYAYLDLVGDALGLIGPHVAELIRLWAAQDGEQKKVAVSAEQIAYAMKTVVTGIVIAKNTIDVLIDGFKLAGKMAGTLAGAMVDAFTKSFTAFERLVKALTPGSGYSIADAIRDNMADMAGIVDRTMQGLSESTGEFWQDFEKHTSDVADAFAFLEKPIREVEAATADLTETTGAAAVATGILSDATKTAAEMKKLMAEATREAARAAESAYRAESDLLNLIEDQAAHLGGPAAQAALRYSRELAGIAEMEAAIMALGPMTIEQVNAVSKARTMAYELYQRELDDMDTETKRVAEESARAWEDFTGGLADAILDGSKGVKRWWKAMLDDMKRQLIQSGLLKIFGSIFNIGGAQASSGVGFGQIMSMFGGGTGSGTGGNVLSSMFSQSSWIQNGQSLWSGFAGMFGGGAAAFGGMGAQVAAMPYFGYTGVGATYGGSYGVMAGSGYGMSGGTATAGTGSGGGLMGSAAMGMAAWFAAAILANMSLYDSGWRPQGGSVDLPWGGQASGDGRGSGGIGWAGNIVTRIAESVLGKLGINERWASILSGGSLVTRAFGHRAPEITGTGVQFGVGDAGVSGEQWADIYQKGGWFRSSRRWTERAGLDADMLADIEAFWQQISAANADIARALGGDTAVAVAASFRQTFDADGEIASEIGTILGRTYNESWEVFAGRIASENIIANIDAALGTTVQRAITGPVPGGPGLGGGIGPGDGIGPGRGGEFDAVMEGIGYTVAKTTQTVGEAFAIAERWRSDANLLAEGAQMLLLAATDIKAGAGLLGEGGTLTQIADLIEELQASGETLSATYARVAGSAALLDQALALSGVQIEGTREHIVRFAAAITDAAGGLERASALWGNYFDRFYTDTERAQFALTQAQSSAAKEFGDIGLDYTQFVGEGGTQAFRELFESVLPTLSAEAVVEWLEAAAALGIVIDATEALNAALGEAAVTAEQLASRAAILADIDSAIEDFGLTEWERRLKDIGAQQQSYITALVETGMSLEDATAAAQRWGDAAKQAAEAARAAQQASILSDIDSAIEDFGLTEWEKQLKGIETQTQSYITALVETGMSLEDATAAAYGWRDAAIQAAEAAMLAQREDITGNLQRDIDRLGMTDYERRLYDIEQQTQDYIAALVETGMTTEQATLAVQAWRDAMLESAEEIRLAAEAQYQQTAQGIADQYAVASGASEYQQSLVRIEREYQSNVQALNAAARAAGRAGAAELDLARALGVATKARAAALAALQAEAQALANTLYGTPLTRLDAQIEALQSAESAASSAVSGFGSAMTDAASAASDAINLLLGDMSPLRAVDKLPIALEALARGETDANTVLGIARDVYGSGRAYNEVFEKVMEMAGTTRPSGSGGGGGPVEGSGLSGGVSPQLQALLDQREKLLAEEEKSRRFMQASQLAEMVAQLSTARGEGFDAIAESLGFGLEQFARDLNFGSVDALTEYLTTLQDDQASIADLYNTPTAGDLLIVQAIESLKQAETGGWGDESLKPEETGGWGDEAVVPADGAVVYPDEVAPVDGGAVYPEDVHVVELSEAHVETSAEQLAMMQRVSELLAELLAEIRARADAVESTADATASTVAVLHEVAGAIDRLGQDGPADAANRRRGG